MRTERSVGWIPALALGLMLVVSVWPWTRAQAGETSGALRAGRTTGVGVALGDLDGVSLKVWTANDLALQVRLGSLSQFNSAGLVVTFARHLYPIEVPDRAYSLPIYMGVGGRFGAISTGVTHLDGGLVLLAGMSVLVPDLPVEVYFELRPSLLLYNNAVGTAGSSLQVGFVLDGGLGAHLYF